MRCSTEKKGFVIGYHRVVKLLAELELEIGKQASPVLLLLADVQAPRGMPERAGSGPDLVQQLVTPATSSNGTVVQD